MHALLDPRLRELLGSAPAATLDTPHTIVVEDVRISVERARAHATLGAAMRRVGRPLEARAPLRVAVDLAHRCGATALEEEALAELRATGARPRRRLITGAGALTDSERRVSELAAGGRKNREIAEALVVTVSTVEYHLRNAYRKLGVPSRAGLGEALARSRASAAVALAGLTPPARLRRGGEFSGVAQQ